MEKIDLKKFYNGEYPFEVMMNMIQNNKDIPFNNRIIMITYKINDNGFIKVRDIDKSNKENLIKVIKNRTPSQIEIGKFYDKFEDFGGSIFMTKNIKEFLFDIDANDFDVDENKDLLLLFKAFNNNIIINNEFKSIRICECIGKKQVCKECWYLIGSSALVIKFFMENLFQIKKFLWVYSGNRGIHCWINDKQLNNLDSEARKSILKMISFSSDQSLFQILSEENVMIMNLYKQLESYFKEYVLSNSIIFTKLKPLILEFIKIYYSLIYNKLNENWKDWNYFEKLSKSNSQWKYQNINIIQPHKFIIFRLLYPLFDENVNQLYHLLKLPFSFHSKTQNLSFPVQYEEIPFILDLKQNFKIEERLKLINDLFYFF